MSWALEAALGPLSNVIFATSTWAPQHQAITEHTCAAAERCQGTNARLEAVQQLSVVEVRVIRDMSLLFGFAAHHAISRTGAKTKRPAVRKPPHPNAASEIGFALELSTHKTLSTTCIFVSDLFSIILCKASGSICP